MAECGGCGWQAVAQRLPRGMRSRFHALYPGGCISKGVLAKERSAVLVVGDTLFTHAGLRIQHLARYARPQDALRDLNLEMSAYFAGQIPQISERTSDVIWTRAYGKVRTAEHWQGVRPICLWWRLGFCGAQHPSAQHLSGQDQSALLQAAVHHRVACPPRRLQFSRSCASG